MPALGLHLKPQGFAAVEVDFKKGERILQKSAFSDFSDFRLNTANNDSVSAYLDRLKEFLFDNNFKSKNAVVALPQDEVFVRTIRVPIMNDKDLDNYIKFESSQYIPLPLEEVTLGYEKMPGTVTDKDKLSVLLVAAKRLTVERYTKIVKDAGLVPLAMEPESLAMTRALKTPSEGSSAELIVELGQEQTLIILSYNGYVILTRTVPFGDQYLIKGLRQVLDLDINQAVEYKNTYGLDKTKVGGKVYSVLAPVFDRVIAEIKKSQTFFATQNPNVKIDKVIVSGQAALTPGLLVYMVDNFNIEVELANPWTKFNSDASVLQDEMIKRGPIFTVPVGLALKIDKKAGGFDEEDVGQDSNPANKVLRKVSALINSRMKSEPSEPPTRPQEKEPSAESKVEEKASIENTKESESAEKSNQEEVVDRNEDREIEATAVEQKTVNESPGEVEKTPDTPQNSSEEKSNLGEETKNDPTVGNEVEKSPDLNSELSSNVEKKQEGPSESEIEQDSLEESSSSEG